MTNETSTSWHQRSHTNVQTHMHAFLSFLSSFSRFSLSCTGPLCVSCFLRLLCSYLLLSHLVTFYPHFFCLFELILFPFLVSFSSYTYSIPWPSHPITFPVFVSLPFSALLVSPPGLFHHPYSPNESCFSSCFVCFIDAESLLLKSSGIHCVSSHDNSEP